MQSRSALLLPVDPSASVILKEKVLSIMIRDEIYQCVVKDHLILAFGSKLCLKFVDTKHLYTHISCKMRELGRLLVVLKKDKQVSALSDVLVPQKFSYLVDCVRELAGFDYETGMVKIPSLAKKLGHSLKQCCDILVTSAVMEGQTERKSEVMDVIYLFNVEWEIQVSKHALRTLETCKWNKSVLLPLTEDIHKLNAYLTEETRRLSNFFFSDNFNYMSWRKLLMLTLARVILFNRKRVGDVQRLTIEAYDRRHSVTSESDGEILKSLTVVEQILAKNFTRVEVRGKKGRKVPLLLSPEVVSHLDLLLKLRSDASVSIHNPYVFGYNEKSYVRGCDALRVVAAECHAAKPELLTSTNLRKHVATVCQLINLQDADIDQLANFLGHDVRIHRYVHR